MFDLPLLILVVFVNLCFAVLVLTRAGRRIQNLLYAVMMFLLSVWSLINYLSNHNTSYSTLLRINRLSFASAILLIVAVWMFSLYFPFRIRSYKSQAVLMLVAGLPSTFLTAFTPLVVKSVNYVPEKQVTDVVAGAHYVAFSLSVGLFFVLLLYNFYKSYRSKLADSLAKQQILYTATGILLTFAWIAITTTILPQATNNWVISKFGIAGSLFLGGFIALAIVKHKLFDIRLVVARTLAYLFTILVLASMYGLVALQVVNRIFFNDAAITTGQQSVYVGLAVVLAFIFQPIKRFFDKVSNRFFYRDAYDIKTAIDGFSTVLVANIDLNIVLKSAQDLLGTTIKPIYSHYYLENEGREPYEFDSRGEKTKVSKDIAALGKKIDKAIIVQDELTDKDRELREIMIQNEVSVIQKLETHTGLVGFAYLGAKKSGGIYNTQDVALLTIMGNELALAVQNALRFEEISQFNLTLQKKVDDATAELQQTNEKLRELDQAKDDFISMASHQLRTPLTSMKGYVSMVLDGDMGKVTKQQKEMLEQAFVSSQRMVYLISDLLNVSRLRTGKFVIENTPTNLADVVEQEIHQLDETAAAKDLKLVYAKPKRFPTVPMDETKMRQVVMNFADNAVYYTPKGGTITIEVKETPKTVEYTCTDNGIGVSKDAQKNLFTKFFRADNAKKARPDGTGLGLYMAKKVIVAQGGSLIFHSEEGKGSTFGFSLPKDEKARPKVDATADEEAETVTKTDDKVAAAAGTTDAEPIHPTTVAMPAQAAANGASSLPKTKTPPK